MCGFRNYIVFPIHYFSSVAVKNNSHFQVSVIFILLYEEDGGGFTLKWRVLRDCLFR